MKNNRLNIKLIFAYVLFGLLINFLSLVIFGISTYLNPKTYHGSIGHNNGSVVLLFFIPIWTIILTRKNRTKDKNALLGFGINALFCVILFSIIALTE